MCCEDACGRKGILKEEMDLQLLSSEGERLISFPPNDQQP